jgi:putative inorganic carbon (hco3(-)) transporter
MSNRGLERQREGLRLVWLATARWIFEHELLLLALVAPVLLFPGRLTPWALGVVLLPWPARRVTTGRLSRPTALATPVLGLVAMAAVGYVVSADRSLSQAKLWGIVLQALVFFAVLNSVHGEQDVKRLGRLLMAGAAGLGLVCLVGTDWSVVRLVEAPGLYDRLPRLIRGLPGSGAAPGQELFHPREVGLAMAVLLPLSLAWLSVSERWWDRLLGVLAASSTAAVLLLSQALAGYLGAASGLLFLLIWRWRRLAVPVAVAVVIGGLAGLAVDWRPVALTLLDVNHPAGVGVVLRLDIWSRGLAILRDVPFTGMGLNTFPLVQTHFYTGYLLGPEPHAHNLPLQTALDLGLPGLAFFGWLLLAFIRSVLRASQNSGGHGLRPLLMGLLASWLAYVVGGLFDVMTLGAKPVVVLFAMLGMAAGAAPGTSHVPSPAHSSRSRLRGVCYPAVALGLMLVAPWLFQDAWQRNLALLQGHQLVYSARNGTVNAEQLAAAAARLESLARQDPGENPHLHGLLGSVHAWLGADQAALNALRRRVVLDLQDPLGRYAPFERWRNDLAGDSAPGHEQSLLRVYGQWRTRYPRRAELYALLAITWAEHGGDSARAISELEAGLAAGAQPAALLARYLEELAAIQVGRDDRSPSHLTNRQQMLQLSPWPAGRGETYQEAAYDRSLPVGE